jgi:N-acetylglucosamine-6-phosphate deacetylase
VRIRVEGGKAVRVADGTIIGGVTPLDEMVRNAVREMAVAPAEALRMASANAASALRLADQVGSLASAAHADFMLLDDELGVTETWVAGQRVWG